MAKQKKTFQQLDAVFGSQVRPTDFGSGRHGYTVNMYQDDHLIGTINLVERPEDGEFSVSFKLAVHVETKLAKAGVKIHKRAKPTRTVLNVWHMLKQAEEYELPTEQEAMRKRAKKA